MIECPLRLKSKDEKLNISHDKCSDLYPYYFSRCKIRDNLLKDPKYRHYKAIVNCLVKNIEKFREIDEDNLCD